MTVFTRIGPGIWNWERWTSLQPSAQILWLGLYTSAEAKSRPPGLFLGSITAMAEASHRPVDETMKSLDQLLDNDLVEFDQKHRVLRMTELPDAGEYPSSPGILESWWSRFQLMPACAVRDSHVTLIRWILDRGAAVAKKNRSKRPTPLHEEVWAATFGTVRVPVPRRRGLRRLLDADTSTDAQPSLFGDRIMPVLTPSPTRLLAASSSSSSDLPDFNNSEMILTLSRGSGEGEGDGDGVLVGGRTDQDPDPDPPLCIGDERPRHLQLVPGPTPAQEEAAERERYAAEMKVLIHEAGGSGLLAR